MGKENQPTLTQLEKRQENLTEIVKERQNLVGEIGSGSVQPELRLGSGIDIKILESKVLVTQSVLRLKETIETISTQIENADERRNLLNRPTYIFTTGPLFTFHPLFRNHPADAQCRLRRDTGPAVLQ